MPFIQDLDKLLCKKTKKADAQLLQRKISITRLINILQRRTDISNNKIMKKLNSHVKSQLRQLKGLKRFIESVQSSQSTASERSSQPVLPSPLDTDPSTLSNPDELRILYYLLLQISIPPKTKGKKAKDESESNDDTSESDDEQEEEEESDEEDDDSDTPHSSKFKQKGSTLKLTTGKSSLRSFSCLIYSSFLIHSSQIYHSHSRCVDAEEHTLHPHKHE